MANYEKWDNLDAGSSDEEGPGPTAAGEFGHQLLSEWLTEANPGIAKEEVERLISFIEVQQPHIGHADNRPRASEVIDWVESNKPVDPKHLLEVVWQGRLRDSKDPGEAARLVRVKAALTSALNTVEAINECGGARALFDCIWKVIRTLAPSQGARHGPEGLDGRRLTVC